MIGTKRRRVKDLRGTSHVVTHIDTLIAIIVLRLRTLRDKRCVKLQYVQTLNPKVDIPLYATDAYSLQIYHSPRAKILALKVLRCGQSVKVQDYYRDMGHIIQDIDTHMAIIVVRISTFEDYGCVQ